MPEHRSTSAVGRGDADRLHELDDRQHGNGGNERSTEPLSFDEATILWWVDHLAPEPLVLGLAGDGAGYERTLMQPREAALAAHRLARRGLVLLARQADSDGPLRILVRAREPGDAYIVRC